MTKPARTTLAYDVSALREREYSRLDASGHVYVDYTGAGLYPESVVREHLKRLTQGVFGNPHSSNPTSSASSTIVERTREAVLEYFRASPSEYEAIFTLNASGALKLVGESYPFEDGDCFLLTYDNHNSVNGIREFARAKGAGFQYVPITDPDLRIDSAALDTMLADDGCPGSHRLFAYPAQSNFSGVQHPLSWVERAQSLGWDVLLDAAAYVPTNCLDLSRVHPDFTVVSFYKMFGYPTGVGCLLARKDALAKLRRPWFSGGTVVIATTHLDPCDVASGFALQQGAPAFEDGTLNYLSIPAVELGMNYLSSVGIHGIHDHVAQLMGTLLEGLKQLVHANGNSLVHIYGPDTTDQRGATVALNFFDPHGHLICPQKVETRAAASNISVRTGCHCNPGAGQTALHIRDDQMASVFKAREQMSLDRFRLVAHGLKEGAVRISLGIVSTQDDIDKVLELAAGFLDCPSETPSHV